MKISYNQLKEYIQTDLSVDELSVLLTNTGLEVESVTRVQSIAGGLEGLLIGEVTHRAQHPNADRLSVTKVNVGGDRELDIVCGAPNVRAGIKVIVATVGCKVHPSEGEPFEIKKSKIRGEVSEGMICSEDEIGLGKEHDGIKELPADAPIGTLASDYFQIKDDYCLEIGLTPNRVDAASHIGTARDVAAVLKSKISLPDVSNFKVDEHTSNIQVKIESEDCGRYSAVSISGVTVKESPDWLQNRLRAIGIRPINNVVDITNYVLHETGQPLHAFDAAELKGKQVLVRKAKEGEPFITIEGTERKLSAEDLMICDGEQAHCIAGVFGGLHSGVKESTTEVFLESAWFNAVSVRKTAKRQGLKTDSSFRFERGTDPNGTVFALKRAALLMKELAGGTISSDIFDHYPKPVQCARINLRWKNINRLIGVEIPQEEIKSILAALEIRVESETAEGLELTVPTNKVDVLREVDVIEEVLRIYGYNNIAIPSKVNSSLSYAQKPDAERLQNALSDFLTAKGFHEIMSNSLTRSTYTALSKQLNADENVQMLNPLSVDLDVLRQTLLFSGLEAIAYNQNRKQADLKLYEFGKAYKTVGGEFIEEPRLALFITGRKEPESWTTKADQTDYYELKGFVDAVLKKMNVDVSSSSPAANTDLMSQGLSYKKGKNLIVEFGSLGKAVLKKMDIDKPVYYAEFNWAYLLKVQQNNKAEYREISKFPAVRRDLSMLLDHSLSFEELKRLAFQIERKLLVEVNLFDQYAGDKLPQGKKSYALSFLLQDETQTLSDKQIEGVMSKMIQGFEKAGAEIRK